MIGLGGKSDEEKAEEEAEARWQEARNQATNQEEANRKQWMAGEVGKAPPNPATEAKRAVLVAAIARATDTIRNDGDFEVAKDMGIKRARWRKLLDELGPAPTPIPDAATQAARQGRVAQAERDAKESRFFPRPGFGDSLKEAGIGGLQGLAQGVLGAGDTLTLGALPRFAPGYKAAQEDLQSKNSPLAGYQGLPNAETMGNVSGAALSMAAGPARAIAKGVTAGVERSAAGLLGQLEQRLPSVARYLGKKVRPGVAVAAKNILGHGVAGGAVQGGAEGLVRGGPKGALESAQTGAALGGPLVALGVPAAAAARKVGHGAGYVRNLIRSENPNIPILESAGAQFGVGTIKNPPTAIQGPPEPGAPPMPNRATGEHRGRLATRTEEVLKGDAEMATTAAGRRFEKDLGHSLGQEGDWHVSMEDIARDLDELAAMPTLSPKHPLARFQAILNGRMEPTAKLRVDDPVDGSWEDAVVESVNPAATGRRFNMSTGQVIDKPRWAARQGGERDVGTTAVARRTETRPVDVEATVELQGTSQPVHATPPAAEEPFTGQGQMEVPASMERDLRRVVGTGPVSVAEKPGVHVGGQGNHREIEIPLGIQGERPGPGGMQMQHVDEIRGPLGEGPQRHLDVRNINRLRDELDEEAKIWAKTSRGDPKKSAYGDYAQRLRGKVETHAPLTHKANADYSQRLALYEQAMKDLKSEGQESLAAQIVRQGAGNEAEGIQHARLARIRDKFPVTAESDLQPELDELYPLGSAADDGKPHTRLTRDNLQSQMDIQAPLAAQERLKLKAGKLVNPLNYFDTEGAPAARLVYPAAARVAKGAGELKDALELRPGPAGPSSSPRFTGFRGKFDEKVSAPLSRRPGGAPWLPGIEDAVREAYERILSERSGVRETAERQSTTAMRGNPTLRKALQRAYDEIVLGPMSRF